MDLEHRLNHLATGDKQQKGKLTGSGEKTHHKDIHGDYVRIGDIYYFNLGEITFYYVVKKGVFIPFGTEVLVDGIYVEQWVETHNRYGKKVRKHAKTFEFSIFSY